MVDAQFISDLKKKPIFNAEGDDDPQHRTIIKGNTTWLFNLNATKYSWAKSLYTIMIGNFRVPEKVSGLNDDSICYQKELTEHERRAYDGILSFLIFLDSIQTVNLPNIADYITAPEVGLLIAIQTYQEAIHSQSYATILESVVDDTKKNEIYYFWRDNEILLERNTYIGKMYQDFVDRPTDASFFKAMIANFLLEWLYFYNGFAFFDTLADHQKMKATDRMINYIRRDELTHVTLFANILREMQREFPILRDEKMIYEMFTIAVEQEIKRAQFILGNNIVGINHKNTELYTKRLANHRLAMLGLDPLYPEVTENPHKHLERLQDNNSEKANFFETTVTNYVQSSSMTGNRDF